MRQRIAEFERITRLEMREKEGVKREKIVERAQSKRSKEQKKDIKIKTLRQPTLISMVRD